MNVTGLNRRSAPAISRTARCAPSGMPASARSRPGSCRSSAAPVPSACGERGAGAALEHKHAFDTYVRAGEDRSLRGLEQKAMSYGSGQDGGYLVPDEIETAIGARLRELSPIRSIATFQARPGHGAAFEAAYREGQFLERAVTNPGFIGGELLRVADDPDRFIAIAEWVDADAYAA